MRRSLKVLLLGPHAYRLMNLHQILNGLGASTDVAWLKRPSRRTVCSNDGAGGYRHL